MTVLDVSKGSLTWAGTGFGRHYHVFRSLREDLKKNSNKKHLDCLVIGPGLQNTYFWDGFGPNDSICFHQDYIKTFQPFELANTVINAGFSDFSIDVLDINKKILNEMGKKPFLIRIYKDFWGKYHHSWDSENHQEDYYKSFFKDCVIDSDAEQKIVQIPERVMSSFNLHNKDIVVDELPKKNYDIVFCTVVLSYYSFNFTHNRDAPAPEISQKIRNSIKKNGYLGISESGSYDNINWGLAGFSSPGPSSSVHYESASLIKKLT